MMFLFQNNTDGKLNKKIFFAYKVVEVNLFVRNTKLQLHINNKVEIVTININLIILNIVLESYVSFS